MMEDAKRNMKLSQLTAEERLFYNKLCTLCGQGEYVATWPQIEQDTNTTISTQMTALMVFGLISVQRFETSPDLTYSIRIL